MDTHATFARTLTAAMVSTLTLGVVAGVTLTVLVTGCANPLAPTVQAAPYVPKHHNIPATLAGQPSAPVLWLCATLPRTYSNHGVTTVEEDHYLQATPCDATLVP